MSKITTTKQAKSALNKAKKTMKTLGITTPIDKIGMAILDKCRIGENQLDLNNDYSRRNCANPAFDYDETVLAHFKRLNYQIEEVKTTSGFWLWKKTKVNHIIKW